MNRLLQTTSKQRENAGDYSADEYMGTVGDLEYRISFPQEGEMILFSDKGRSSAVSSDGRCDRCIHIQPGRIQYRLG